MLLLTETWDMLVSMNFWVLDDTYITLWRDGEDKTGMREYDPSGAPGPVGLFWHVVLTAQKINLTGNMGGPIVRSYFS
jgi:hypothetical protein